MMSLYYYVYIPTIDVSVIQKKANFLKFRLGQFSYEILDIRKKIQKNSQCFII